VDRRDGVSPPTRAASPATHPTRARQGRSAHHGPRNRTKKPSFSPRARCHATATPPSSSACHPSTPNRRIASPSRPRLSVPRPGLALNTPPPPLFNPAAAAALRAPTFVWLKVLDATEGGRLPVEVTAPRPLRDAGEAVGVGGGAPAGGPPLAGPPLPPPRRAALLPAPPRHAAPHPAPPGRPAALRGPRQGRLPLYRPREGAARLPLGRLLPRKHAFFSLFIQPPA
jgi:hypothetical protein